MVCPGIRIPPLPFKKCDPDHPHPEFLRPSDAAQGEQRIEGDVIKGLALTWNDGRRSRSARNHLDERFVGSAHACVIRITVPLCTPRYPCARKNESLRGGFQGAMGYRSPTTFQYGSLGRKRKYGSEHAAVTWLGLQVLRDHETTSTAIIQVLRGRVRLNTVVKRVLQIGHAVQLAPSERHALTALEDSLVQLLLVPHPYYPGMAGGIDLPASP